MVGANFLAIAARMSLVQFLGIYYAHRVGLDIALIGLGFLCESLARGLLAPNIGASRPRARLSHRKPSPIRAISRPTRCA